MKIKYVLVTETETPHILDTETNEVFCYLAVTGFGVRRSTIELALKVVAFLNSSLPQPN